MASSFGAAEPSPFPMKFEDLKEKHLYWPYAKEPGSREEALGKLRLLTPDVVAAAARSEIQTGERTCLNWEMTQLEHPGFSRDPLSHTIKWVPNYEGVAFDDTYTFNPQAGSQWDGFRHYSIPNPAKSTSASVDVPDRVFHGGTSGAEIIDSPSTRIGIGHWAQKGIAGRGVLIDYVSYAEKHGLPVDGLGDVMVSLDKLYDIAKECNVTFQLGDILFLRVGLTKAVEAMSTEQKKGYRQATAEQKHAHSGLEQSERVCKFLWDNHFTAVASDGVSFEVRPTRDVKWSLHHILLAGWGVPIGEMFYLEDLAELCKRHKRWSFFVTSAPLNVPRGCSSSPNCMALF